MGETGDHQLQVALVAPEPELSRTRVGDTEPRSL
jgi:hypothetical protein